MKMTNQEIFDLPAENEYKLMERLDNLEGCEDNSVYAAEIREIRRELQRIHDE